MASPGIRKDVVVHFVNPIEEKWSMDGEFGAKYTGYLSFVDVVAFQRDAFYQMISEQPLGGEVVTKIPLCNIAYIDEVPTREGRRA